MFHDMSILEMFHGNLKCQKHAFKYDLSLLLIL